MKKFSVAKYGLLPAHYLACKYFDTIRERLAKELQETLDKL